MKRDIVLLIIRDHAMDLTIDTIKEYLSITAEQVFHVIDFLIKSELVIFKEGELHITNEGYNTLERSNLNAFSLEDIEETTIIVDESPLKNYIPK
ncbi:hypothetical protein [Pontibacillus yanchengensis]|nr:hypothetical protein [Pontibacillus yanchengensis]